MKQHPSAVHVRHRTRWRSSRFVAIGLLTILLVPLLAATGECMTFDESGSVYGATPHKVPDGAAPWRAVDARKSVVRSLATRATRGDAEAARELGRMYREGDCVTADPLEARRWLGMASRAGDAAASRQLATMMDEGEGGLVDAAGSLGLLKSMADRGDAEAALELGRAYLLGDRVAPDVEAARSWLLRAQACAAPNATSLLDQIDLHLAWASEGGALRWATTPETRGHYVDILRRSGWLDHLDDYRRNHQSVDAAAGRAMIELARCHEVGIGGPRDPKEARRWYVAATNSPLEDWAATKLASMVGQWDRRGWPDCPFGVDALIRIFERPQGAWPADENGLSLVFPEGVPLSRPARDAVTELLERAARGEDRLPYMAGLMALNGWGVERDAVKARQWFELAAKNPNPVAAMMLGAMARHGVGGPVDEAAAKRWYQLALVGNVVSYPDQHYQQAFLEKDGKRLVPDFAARLDDMARNAASGDAVAQLQRARQFRQAFGELPDMAASMRWYAASARQGQANALMELADIQQWNVWLPNYRDEWLRLLRKAAAAGQAMAAYHLAIATDPGSGWDAPKRAADSRRWWVRAAELGMVNGSLEVLRRLDRDQDYAAMAPWYEVAIDQGMDTMKAELARMYLKGKGVPQDLERARAMFESLKGTKFQDTFHLGLMLELGLGGMADLPEAVRLYRPAADEGDQRCSYRLALMFEEGRGVARDDRQARHYYENVVENETAEGGPEAEETHEANYRLGRMMEDGRGGPKDRKGAVARYRISASAHAVRRLGHLLEQGIDGKADPQAATKLYKDFAWRQVYWYGPQLEFLERNVRGACLGEGLATVLAALEKAGATDPAADVLMGRLLEKGVGLPKAPWLARRYYEQAAQRGDASACYLMGLQEEDGTLGKKDAAKAAQFFRQAVAHARTRYEIDMFGGGESVPYLNALRWLYKVRDDVTPSRDDQMVAMSVSMMMPSAPEAWRDIVRRAAAGDEQAGWVLEYWVFHPGSLRRLTARDFEELEALATSDNLPAQLLLASYRRASGDEAGSARALPAVVKAADAGDPLAQRLLGSLWALGNEAGRDRVSAHAYLNLAAAQGDLRAAAARDALTPSLEPTEHLEAEQKALAMWRRQNHSLLE